MSKENNLVSFSRAREIIANIDQNKLISYEGSIGTSEQVGVSPYQFIEIRIAFYNGNNGEDSNS
jgi:hypothetical protein